MHHLRYAWRGFLRHPVFTLVTVLTLALGVGANAAIFSLAYATLLRALPYPQPERVILPWEYSEEVRARLGFDWLPSSPGDYTDYHDRNTSFVAFASMRNDRGLNLTGSGEPERVAGARVGAEFFEVLGVRPIVGRTFDRNDTGRLVVIAHALWQRRFGGDPSIAGRVVSLNGEPATIVGVMPPWFRFPASPELPEALGFAPDPVVWSLDTLTPEQRQLRGSKHIAMIGRLGDGVTAEMAQADLAGIASDLARSNPETNAGWTIRTVSLREQLVRPLRSWLILMLVAVGFVLLIACANVAILLLVRATTRYRELSVRQALGASRRSLVLHMLVESVMFGVVAGAVGLLLGWWILRVVLASPPATMAALAQASMSWPVVVASFAIALVTGLFFGLVPAWQATRPGALEALRDGARGMVGRRGGRRTRNGLVVLEVAVALLLLIGTALLAQTLLQLMRVKTGFRTDGVLTMDIALPESAYPGPIAAAFFDALLARVSILPGVEAAGVTSALPLTGSENLVLLTVEGQPRPEPGHELIADYRVVTPGYFRVMGIPTIDGELLPERTQADGLRLVVVSETTARTCWPGMDALGRRLKLSPYDPAAPWYTVIGVVGDTRHTSLDSPPRAQVYVHQRHDPYEHMTLVIRTSGAPLALAPAARTAVSLIDPNQPVSRVASMDQIVALSTAARRFHMMVVAAFAGLAAVLSLVGLYAVVAFSVAERLHEMAVRAALGARPADLLVHVLSDGLRLAAGGIAAGLVAAFVLTRYLQTLLYGIPPRDLATFVIVPLLLLAAALLGCFVPAVRAMRVNPATALRAE